MTDTELDTVYTQLCQTMTALGAERAPLFLARFALLAMVALDDPARLRAMIADAADGVHQAAPTP